MQSVRVMLSYDYNHFETILSCPDEATPKEVNERRKEATRLCIEGIRQYQKAKAKASQRANILVERQRLEEEVSRILTEPEGEWTAEEKAKVKALEDHEYWTQHNYDFDDDPEEYR